MSPTYRRSFGRAEESSAGEEVGSERMKVDRKDDKSFLMYACISAASPWRKSIWIQHAQPISNGKIVAAAKLLAHANAHVIGLSETSAGWMGFWADEELCAPIIAATVGIPVTMSVLGLNRAIRVLSAKQLGLVRSYVDQVQTDICKTIVPSEWTVPENDTLNFPRIWLSRR